MIEHAENTGNDEIATELGKHQEMERQEKSYIGRIGQAIEPVLKPLGFDWKIGVSLFTGMAAKEVVVSTMGVLYSGDEEADPETLGERLLAQKDKEGYPVFTPLVGYQLTVVCTYLLSLYSSSCGY